MSWASATEPLTINRPPVTHRPSVHPCRSFIHAPTLTLRTASAAVVFAATLTTTDGAFTCEAIASGPGAGFSLVSMNDAACTTRITSLNSLTAACNPSVTPAPLGCTDSSFTGGSLKHLSEVGVFDSSCVAISRLMHTMDEFDGGVSFNVQVSTRVTRHDRFHIPVLVFT